jgi:hypothetical protein
LATRFDQQVALDPGAQPLVGGERSRFFDEHPGAVHVDAPRGQRSQGVGEMLDELAGQLHPGPSMAGRNTQLGGHDRGGGADAVVGVPGTVLGAAGEHRLPSQRCDGPDLASIRSGLRPLPAGDRVDQLGLGFGLGVMLAGRLVRRGAGNGVGQIDDAGSHRDPVRAGCQRSERHSHRWGGRHRESRPIEHVYETSRASDNSVEPRGESG